VKKPTANLEPIKHKTGVSNFTFKCILYRCAAEGLCALADRWLADVAFPSFRDSARVSPVPTVVDWFDEPKVQSFCTRYEVGLYKLNPVDAQLEIAWFQPSRP
jgi:hypothetical protein